MYCPLNKHTIHVLYARWELEFLGYAQSRAIIFNNCFQINRTVVFTN